MKCLYILQGTAEKLFPDDVCAVILVKPVHIHSFLKMESAVPGTRVVIIPCSVLWIGGEGERLSWIKLDCYFGYFPSFWLFVKNTQRFENWIHLRHQVKVGDRGANCVGSLKHSYSSFLFL